ncbi:hypothetical protein SDC9_29559 [bioreactor metagenome]|uniref:Uncharacterized protein n=2 Tax=root TaxID=1 RepID=A0A098B1I5_DESHA|nr:Hypothetical protein DPCES_2323 [Desulfitobacterium hafniense]
MRNIKAGSELATSPEPYVIVKDNLRVKEVVHQSKRYIVCLKKRRTNEISWSENKSWLN